MTSASNTTKRATCCSDVASQPNDQFMGHEDVGVVEDVGTKVKNVKVGDLSSVLLSSPTTHARFAG